MSEIEHDGVLPGLGTAQLPDLVTPKTKWELWKERRLKWALLAGALALTVGAGAVVVPILTASPSACSGGLVAVQDAGTTMCVGLTDGSQVLDPGLAGIEDLILRENNRVAGIRDTPSVGIAYLMPMTVDSASPVTRTAVLHELQGAYTAQWEANHGSSGDSPLIRLYLANTGSDGSQWRVPVTQVEAAAADSRDMVAVAGMGISQQNSRDAATELSRFRMAMFGATITADDFNGATYSGLVRTVPTNTDEVKAALEFLNPADDTAMLVQDTDRTDDYATTWSSEVLALYPVGGRKIIDQEPFDRLLGAVGDRFVQIARVACEKQPSVLFFAGRAKELEQFVGTLGANCASPVTVISGDDSAIDAQTGTEQAYTSYEQALGPGKDSLYTVANANPDEWTACGPIPAGQQAAQHTFATFRQDYYAQLLGTQAASLDDGYAIMARDAVMAAVQTIRLPVQQAQSQTTMRYQEVTQNISALHDTPLFGAGGTTVISNSGPTAGNTLGKPLAIVQHRPDGSLTCRRLVVP